MNRIAQMKKPDWGLGMMQDTKRILQTLLNTQHVENMEIGQNSINHNE